MGNFGLLGEKLGHSYSPAIHTLLGSSPYELIEKGPWQVEHFLRTGDFDGLNVTIPYKKSALCCCDVLSDTAKAVGSVNTLLRLPDGRLFGDNTDVWGFRVMLEKCGIEAAGQKALILGSGGAMTAVRHVLTEQGFNTVIISRSGDDNYGNLHRHRDAGLIVNTTPVGMFPQTGAAPLDLRSFTNCAAVLDIVYNPARTALLMQAEELGIVCQGGLLMLAAQAAKSSELFLGKSHPADVTEQIYRKLSADSENIAVIGMPGSGKTSVGKALSEITGRGFADSDEEIVKLSGKSIPRIFSEDGEDTFRRMETEVLKELGKRSGLVIATGGGCVTREENYPLLHQNSRIVWLRRDLELLCREGRPLSANTDLKAMERTRTPMYRRFSDMEIENNRSLYEAAELIRAKIYESSDR